MANIEPNATLPENAAPEAVPAPANAAPPAVPAPEPVHPDAVPKTSSHDLTPPPAFVDWMMQGWKAPSAKPPRPIPNAARFRARRAALSARFPGETLVIPTGHEKIRVNDTGYRFRPSSDFFYLVGNHEPDCVLVLEPKDGGGHADVLWVEPNPGKTTPTFFTDRAKGELWVGPRLGVEKSRVRYGVDECRPLPELATYLAALHGASPRPFRVVRDLAGDVDAALPAQDERDTELVQAIHELRLIKDPTEIREIEEAIAATKNALEGVIASLPDAESERVVEALFDAHARIHGNGVSFETIAASGADAAILHWTRNDAPIDRAALLLMDCGVESNGLYAADVSRTFPANGRFSPVQREVYDLVIEARAAAIEAVKPGADFLAPHRAAMAVFARGLARLGLLADAEEALKEENQFYKRFTLHGVSHMLGLDVHDCARARPEKYRQGQLEPGMVLTIEPGLYFQLDDEKVPRKYRGIGIRVEDDVLVTAKGCRILTEEIPRTADEIEAWMASIWGMGLGEEEAPAPAPAKKRGARKAVKTAAKAGRRAATGARKAAAKAGRKVAGAAKKAAGTAKQAAGRARRAAKRPAARRGK
jgi:Xaa-Pro aminopeptidase